MIKGTHEKLSSFSNFALIKFVSRHLDSATLAFLQVWLPKNSSKNPSFSKVPRAVNCGSLTKSENFSANFCSKKSKISQDFSKKSASYNKLASVQRLAVSILIKKLTPFLRRGQSIADLGSGTSFFAKNLSNRLKFQNFNFKIFEFDLAFEMLNFWKSRPKNVFPILADFENLHLKKKKFDIIVSSFALQWIEDFETFFINIEKCLNAKARLFICLPTSESLQDIQRNTSFYFNDLPKIELIISSSYQSKLKLEEVYTVSINQKFKDRISALRWFKEIGANYKKHEVIQNNIKKESGYISINKVSSVKNTKYNYDFIRHKSLSNHQNSYSLNWQISYFIFQKND